MLPTRDPTKKKRHTQTESEGMQKTIPSNSTGNKHRIPILISDKIDFKKRAIKKDPEGHFIILKGKIHQEDINIVNIHAPSLVALKYIYENL